METDTFYEQIILAIHSNSVQMHTGIFQTLFCMLPWTIQINDQEMGHSMAAYKGCHIFLKLDTAVPCMPPVY